MIHPSHKDAAMRARGRCALVLAVLLALPMAAEAAPDGTEPPAARPAGYNDSGAQLSRTRQYLEEQQARERLAKENNTAGVEGADVPEAQQGGNISFPLKKIEWGASSVLTDDELQQFAAPYVGHEVKLADLYTLINQINALYQKRGYMTCRAFLGPQTIHDGVVKIELIEGRTGQVSLTDNRTTREDYVRHRLSLKKGEVANIHDLNEELLRFNATNDAQLHIVMKAGAEVGTTDYVIAVREPQLYQFGIVADNAGNKSSGLYRGGFFWQDRSLTGNRDVLFLSTMASQGTKSFAAGYTAPLDRMGSKIGVNYTTNSVHITDGALEPLKVRGHSYAYDLFVTNPVVTSETVRSEIGLDYGYQHSRTDFLGMPWVDDTVQTLQAFYDQLDYGRSTIWYQKHAYAIGKAQTMQGDRNFGKYNMNGLFGKHFAHGQSWTMRLDGQLSSTQYLPSAEMFYIGGMYSVRGYTESLLGGDGGLSMGLEYSVPVTKGLEAYLFLDGGRVWGSSAFGDRSLAGTGFGLKGSLGAHAYLNVGLGFPLIRTVNEVEQSRARVHFSFNSQF
ncbi:ShlB/FhaC/HecB family hemolysin secretion/activation protein [Mitsuokella jalaludinii]|uniref:ShlB/FhaC/HecB family hemolysin secretion/activation protein n=1 Tax=Mitsuokella jalaludinii TaxID=187979 RepID=UPI0022DEFA6D|nr:ShlB/FhaC/HecB family hemolysin secretion/activation protein [Mitsuokella jalaludinii]